MIENILRGVRIRTPEYTQEHRAEDDFRLRQRIAQVSERRNRADQFRAHGWLVPSSPELTCLQLASASPAGKAVKTRIERDLTDLCRMVIKAPGCKERLIEFVGAARPTDQVGARVFGCMLLLGGHDEGARFWWGFAAGVGDGTAAYALFLDGLLRDDPDAATRCYLDWRGKDFTTDKDWEPVRPSKVEPAFEQQIDSHVREVTTGPEAQHVPIPEGYLQDVTQEQRDELLCGR
ncbi:hypothetical protein [Streptomyces sp. NPDC057287]|uniref:hypothetical protein n=1 Tax=Streptomyces sp. NPDC057287 TaxID=3346086 RepID=UPI003625D29F